MINDEDERRMKKTDAFAVGLGTDKQDVQMVVPRAFVDPHHKSADDSAVFANAPGNTVMDAAPYNLPPEIRLIMAYPLEPYGRSHVLLPAYQNVNQKIRKDFLRRHCFRQAGFRAETIKFLINR